MAEQRVAPESGLPPDVEHTVVTVGTFDGVHRGHQDVLARLAARARELGCPSVLVTFEPHPLEIVNPSAAPPLLTVGLEKIEVLAESGINYVAIVPFTTTLAAYDASRFVSEVLVRLFRVKRLLMGHDHGFGRNRAGGVDVVRALGLEHGFDVEVVPAVAVGDGPPISSTAIRRAVAGGDLDRAAAALGRFYAVSGRVIQGDRRGRVLGFPTINVPVPAPRKLLPPQGVYAVRVQTPAGPFDGMLNLGPRPTFGDSAVSLEAHLFDADVDLYDASVRIDFVARIRSTQKFEGVSDLVAQLMKDSIAAKGLLASR